MKKSFCIMLCLAVSFSLLGCENQASTNNIKNTATKQVVKSERKVEGKAIDLGAGNYTIGKDIEPGVYDLTSVSGEQGDITVNAPESNLDSSLSCTSDILGGTKSADDITHMAVSKIRLKLIKDSQINIMNISKTHFEPVTTPFVDKTPKDITLNEGRYVVGEDIAPGRYKISAVYGSGAVYVMNKNNPQIQQNIADNSNDATKGYPKEATITLENDEVVFNSGIDSVEFIPQ